MEREQARLHNSVGGVARDVIQAQIINGDIHLHQFQPTVPRQLPGSVVTLVNQRRVINVLYDMMRDRPELSEPAIVILLGPRGCGKSTVATYSLDRRASAFPDGQLHANLGAWSIQTRTVSEVLGDFLLALGVSAAEMPTDLAARQGMFRSLTYGGAYQILLEDVVSPAQVRSLLPGRGRSVVVVTGHGAFASLTSQGARLIDVEPLEDDMAELLLRKFAGDRIDERPEQLRELLAWCAGLPVAVCVVGALLAEFPELGLAELMAEIRADDRGLASLTVDDEQTLGSLFDAVYRRLSPQAQRCYRVIGTCPGLGDISVDALGAVAGLAGLEFQRALRELEMMRVVDRPAPGRLKVHVLVRAHGGRVASQPETAVEQTDVIHRLVRWYLDGAVVAESRLMSQRGMRQHLFPDLAVDTTHPALADPHGWMEDERSALRDMVLLAHRGGDAVSVIRLCVVLWSLYEPGKYVDDLLATHGPALRDARRIGQRSVRALLMVQMSFAYLNSGQAERALVLAEGALAQAKAAADTIVVATAAESAGLAALAVGDRSRAVELLELNLAIAQEIGDPRRIALACLHLAKATPPPRALDLLDKAMRLFHSLPELEAWNVAKVLTWQGRSLHAMGDLVTANQRLTDALAMFEKTKRPFDIAHVLDDLGDLAVSAGDIDGARRLYRQALKVYEEGGFVVCAVASQTRLAALS